MPVREIVKRQFLVTDQRPSTVRDRRKRVVLSVHGTRAEAEVAARGHAFEAHVVPASSYRRIPAYAPTPEGWSEA